MMWHAQTPQGKIYWLDELKNPLIGSPIVALRLRQASETGLKPFVTGETIQIDLSTPGDVVWALETIYLDEVEFSPEAPKATEFFEPFQANVIY